MYRKSLFSNPFAHSSKKHSKSSKKAVHAETPASVPSIHQKNPPPPRHIAIIMDGNGRWAKSRGLPRLLGHQRGSQAVNECVQGCQEENVEFLTLYAFSEENWKRPSSEIQGLMTLLDRFLEEKGQDMLRYGVRLQAIGELTQLPQSCQKRLQQAIAATAHNTKLTLTLALSYGGRSEITQAVRNIVADIQTGYVKAQEISQSLISSYLYTKDLPDPDLLIRTSGELRLSNFLLWQLSYTEIYVTPKYWPDFTKSDLLSAITDYQRRSRRYGGLLENES